MKQLLAVSLLCLLFAGCVHTRRTAQFQFVEAFFGARSKGQNVEKFFCDPAFGMTPVADLVAPTSWMLKDDKDPDKVHNQERNTFVYYINSSDAKGQKVYKVWSVSIKANKDSWCIVNLEERK